VPVLAVADPSTWMRLPRLRFAVDCQGDQLGIVPGTETSCHDWSQAAGRRPIGGRASFGPINSASQIRSRPCPLAPAAAGVC